MTPPSDPDAIAAYCATIFDAHQAAFSATRSALQHRLPALVDIAARTIGKGGKILLFGNGGSASDAQHIAAELVGRLAADRAPIPAIALTTDSSALTAIANDYGFEAVFARQIAALGRPGDLAIGISTSGSSPNILAGLSAAKTGGMVAAGLSGRDGGAMTGLADPLLVIPDDDTARIQEMHILIGHILCGALERRLGLL
ncbi:D-sedoheptulose 7-phosphate isomerase [Oceanibacterium hippocampi]|uniref:Phosphoheptose isomerase n=1 Tax=Oceanibacterium hippocampi TaxID=745714 RepID=A0A1Y5RMV6_9PROT|nr:D-sedoheptulose 7-phosphate isomerase [Oceanibacterium hippocampi]SLN21184.1 Phosphoheptose isomerase 1 [Oceanibacterium hippocampi]